MRCSDSETCDGVALVGGKRRPSWAKAGRVQASRRASEESRSDQIVLQRFHLAASNRTFVKPSCPWWALFIPKRVHLYVYLARGVRTGHLRGPSLLSGS